MRRAITQLGCFALLGVSVFLGGSALAQGIVSTGPFGVNGGPTPGAAKGPPYGINSPDYGDDEGKPAKGARSGSEMAINPSYGAPPTTPSPKKTAPAASTVVPTTKPGTSQGQ